MNKKERKQRRESDRDTTASASQCNKKVSGFQKSHKNKAYSSLLLHTDNFGLRSTDDINYLNIGIFKSIDHITIFIIVSMQKISKRET